MPLPPRSTVRPDADSWYANPTRGPRLFQSVANARSGVPFTPAKVTTPGVPETGLIASGSNEFILLSTSYRGSSASQRRP